MLPQVGHWEKVVWRNVQKHVPPDFGIPSCVDCKRPDLSDKLGEELARTTHTPSLGTAPKSRVTTLEVKLSIWWCRFCLWTSNDS